MVVVLPNDGVEIPPPPGGIVRVVPVKVGDGVLVDVVDVGVVVVLVLVELEVVLVEVDFEMDDVEEVLCDVVPDPEVVEPVLVLEFVVDDVDVEVPDVAI